MPGPVYSMQPTLSTLCDASALSSREEMHIYIFA